MTALADNEAKKKGMIDMSQSTHIMLRLLSDDAGLGAPVEARYDSNRRARKIKASAVAGALATGFVIVAAALLASLG